MITRTAVKAVTAGLLVAAGLVASQTSIANADPISGTTPPVTCTYAGTTYSVGAKVYHPDGTYQLCRSDGTWLFQTPPVTGKPGIGSAQVAPPARSFS